MRGSGRVRSCRLVPSSCRSLQSRASAARRGSLPRPPRATSSVPVMTLMTSEVTPARRSALAERADEEHAGDDAVQRAAAAEDRHPAEQHRRDDRQLHARRVVAAGAAVQQREVDAGEARDGAAEDEEDELRAPDVDAGERAASLFRPIA